MKKLKKIFEAAEKTANGVFSAGKTVIKILKIAVVIVILTVVYKVFSFIQKMESIVNDSPLATIIKEDKGENKKDEEDSVWNTLLTSRAEKTKMHRKRYPIITPQNFWFMSHLSARDIIHEIREYKGLTQKEFNKIEEVINRDIEKGCGPTLLESGSDRIKSLDMKIVRKLKLKHIPHLDRINCYRNLLPEDREDLKEQLLKSPTPFNNLKELIRNDILSPQIIERLINKYPAQLSLRQIKLLKDKFSNLETSVLIKPRLLHSPSRLIRENAVMFPGILNEIHVRNEAGQYRRRQKLFQLFSKIKSRDLGLVFRNLNDETKAALAEEAAGFIDFLMMVDRVSCEDRDLAEWILETSLFQKSESEYERKKWAEYNEGFLKRCPKEEE